MRHRVLASGSVFAALVSSMLAGALGLTGCGGGAEQEDLQQPREDAGKPRVALVMKSLANEFFARHHTKCNVSLVGAASARAASSLANSQASFVLVSSRVGMSAVLLMVTAFSV